MDCTAAPLGQLSSSLYFSNDFLSPAVNFNFGRRPLESREFFNINSNALVNFLVQRRAFKRRREMSEEKKSREDGKRHTRHDVMRSPVSVAETCWLVTSRRGWWKSTIAEESTFPKLPTSQRVKVQLSQFMLIKWVTTRPQEFSSLLRRFQRRRRWNGWTCDLSSSQRSFLTHQRLSPRESEIQLRMCALNISVGARVCVCFCNFAHMKNYANRRIFSRPHPTDSAVLCEI